MNLTNITSEKIDNAYEKYDRYTEQGCLGCFPGFYNTRLYDKDNDGDFDLVPDDIAIWWRYFGPNYNEPSKDRYWENINGSFYKRN